LAFGFTALTGAFGGWAADDRTGRDGRGGADRPTEGRAEPDQCVIGVRDRRWRHRRLDRDHGVRAGQRDPGDLDGEEHTKGAGDERRGQPASGIRHGNTIGRRSG
jgi:hypothetical protein